MEIFQISGTAAKLGQPNAYHHCTLLVDSNKNHIREALAKDEVNCKRTIFNFKLHLIWFCWFLGWNCDKSHTIRTITGEKFSWCQSSCEFTAASICRWVRNACHFILRLMVSLNEIIKKKKSNWNIISSFRYEFLRTSATELHDGGRHLMMKQRGFQLINPTEKWFPGLMEIRDQFSAWDWCYGKTPKFTVQKELQLKSDEKDHNVQLNITVNAVS